MGERISTEAQERNKRLISVLSEVASRLPDNLPIWELVPIDNNDSEITREWYELVNGFGGEEYIYLKRALTTIPRLRKSYRESIGTLGEFRELIKNGFSDQFGVGPAYRELYSIFNKIKESDENWQI